MFTTSSNTLSQREKKLIVALQQVKVRRAEGLFVAEGPKLIGELLATFPCRLLVTTASFLPLVEGLGQIQRVVLLPEEYDFSSLSTLRTPRPMIALLELPTPLSTSTITAPSLLLDNVQDPGNVGSILRTADWFGCRSVFTTEGTADPFSPKVVQATMGALARVKVTPVTDIHSLLGQAHRDGVAILGTFLEGEDILAHHSTPLFSSPYLLIMGNEGQGISPSVAQYVTQRLTIPSSSPDGKQVESLNVAAATAIVLACLHRH